MNITPVNINFIPRTNNKTNNKNSTISFERNFLTTIVDSFKPAVTLNAFNAKTSQIEDDLASFAEILKEVNTSSKYENVIKKYSVTIGKMNNFKMYTVVDEEKREKLLFNNLENPDEATIMSRYSFLDGINLVKQYEFYDDTFKNYKLVNLKDVSLFDENKQTQSEYLFSDGKMYYFKNVDSASNDAFEIIIGKDTKTYKEGTINEDGDIVFPTTIINLSKDKHQSEYIEYNEKNGNYDVYKLDKTTKTWVKARTEKQY